MKNKKINNQTRQAFLLTFFGQDPYGVKEINGFFLEKHPNGNTGGSEVAIYTKASWKKKTQYIENQRESNKKLTDF